jgi:outer membrane immunogenic protein
MRGSMFFVSAAMAGAVLGISAAAAADLPARIYTKAQPIVDTSYNWSGIYVA